MEDYIFAECEETKNDVILNEIIYENKNHNKIKNITIENLICCSQKLNLKQNIYNLTNLNITQNYVLTNDLLLLKKIFDVYNDKIKINDLYDLYFESVQHNYLISFKYLFDIIEYNSSIEDLSYENNSTDILNFLLLKNKIKLNSETFYKTIKNNCLEFLKILHQKKCVYDLNHFIMLYIPFDCFQFLNENDYKFKNKISENYISQILKHFDYEYFKYFIEQHFYYNHEIIGNLLNYYYNTFKNFLDKVSNTVKNIQFNDNKLCIIEHICYFGFGTLTLYSKTEIKNFYNDYLKSLNITKDKTNIKHLKNLVLLLFKMKTLLEEKIKLRNIVKNKISTLSFVV